MKTTWWEDMSGLLKFFFLILVPVCLIIATFAGVVVTAIHMGFGL